MTKATKVLGSSIASLIFGGGIYLSSFSGSEVTPLDEDIPQADSKQNLNIQTSQPWIETKAEATPEKSSKSTNPRVYKGGVEWKDGNDWFYKSVAEKRPEWKERYPFFIDQAESFKDTDPVYYRHQHDNPFKEREISLEKAKEKLNVIMDHTMMVSYSVGCPIGTAWIFDYVLPEEGKSYPTKFFIASNGHVVNKFKWDEKNPYQQELSNVEADMGEDWKNSYCVEKPDEITLVKEKIEHYDDDFNKNNWSYSHQQYQGKEMWLPNETFDVSKYKDLEDVIGDYWQFKFKNPKLVYFPYKYLGEDRKKQLSPSLQQKHDVADFAVFEVDFEHENVAKLFTRDFYGKYNRDNGTHKEKALNFFADPLHKKYTSQQLLENDVQILTAGYPSKGMAHKASSNYNLNRKSASRLTYYDSIENEQGHRILGHSEGGYGWTWNGKSYNPGSLYSYDNPEISNGASGSLIVEENGDVLGLHSGDDKISKVGFGTPLRNIDIKNRNGEIVSLAYDFIEGMEGQNGSYKEQIQKYFLSKGQQTGLSKFRNWTALEN